MTKPIENFLLKINNNTMTTTNTKYEGRYIYIYEYIVIDSGGAEYEIKSLKANISKTVPQIDLYLLYLFL